MNAVILGYGVVGKGIEILAKTLDDINIKYVYVRKEKENLPYFSNNEDMVVQDDIDIVFECLNGLEPANTLIQKALKKGKHVVEFRYQTPYFVQGAIGSLIGIFIFACICLYDKVRKKETMKRQGKQSEKRSRK